MKKILPALLLICGSVATAQAQLLPGFEVGLKGALNFSKFKSDGKYFSSDNKAGYQAGLYGRVGVLGFHVQPEVYLTGKNTTVKAENGETTDVKFTTVDIPVLLGKRFGLGPIGARIQTGPIFSFKVDDNQDKIIEQLNPNSYKKSGTSWAFGVGADISSLRVDLRYEMGLNKVNNESQANPKINMWSIGLGYRLFSIL
ncbi:PorT family protein [Sphingobacterium sp. ML3W]|uniref:Outer membrane protein with beta-barrel domain n=1 Tax=Sphingobacterium detergens TaxID=1145106 RepID=A0A420AG11_SPHD1|nr:MULTISPECIES: porin family protein [Sphingobacterium]RKE43306.1 outer membrane protein with beta-barrel domain [Sphingobacterium detergens]WFA77844.1 PorT family protein [Sphingobacterium sp. ML3W]